MSGRFSQRTENTKPAERQNLELVAIIFRSERSIYFSTSLPPMTSGRGPFRWPSKLSGTRAREIAETFLSTSRPPPAEGFAIPRGRPSPAVLFGEFRERGLLGTEARSRAIEMDYRRRRRETRKENRTRPRSEKRRDYRDKFRCNRKLRDNKIQTYTRPSNGGCGATARAEEKLVETRSIVFQL